MFTRTRQQEFAWELKVKLKASIINNGHSPFRKTFELGESASTAGKSILNLVKW